MTNKQGHEDQDGSATMVGELVVRHERRIRSFISRRSGPQVLRRTGLDDLFQQTVAAAVASAPRFQYRSDAAFLAWIYTIASRVINRVLHNGAAPVQTVRLRRAASSGVGVSEGELSAGIRTPSSFAARDENIAAMHLALGRLPEHYRRVIILYKLEQRSLSETAVAIGKTKGATCRLLARALERLRSEMDADDLLQ